MRKLLLGSAAVLAVSIAFAAPNKASAAPIFPKIGDSTGGPAVIITLTDGGPQFQFLSSQTYDGSDDVEVGLINSSSTTQTSLMLTGSGNGGGIFGFDGDGIVHYIDANTGKLTVGNPSDTSGYAGPGVTYSGINAAETSGTVNFNLAPGDFTYFGLEGSPDSIAAGGGLGGGGGTPVPEPASAMLLLSGLSALGVMVRRKRGA